MASGSAFKTYHSTLAASTVDTVTLTAWTRYVLVVNKFGKSEAEGGGLRDVMADVVAAGIPLLIGNTAPATPTPLSVACAIVPATWVPCA